MFDGRKKTTALTALGLALGGSLIATTNNPAQADPQSDHHKLQQAQERADTLMHQAEVASEKANNARIQLNKTQHELAKLDKQVGAQQGAVTSMRGQVASILVDNFQTRDQGLSTAGQLVTSDDPDQLVHNLSAMDSFEDQRGEVLHQYRDRLDELSAAKKQAADHVDELARIKTELVANQKVIERKSADAKAILSKLKEKQAASAAGDAGGSAQAAPASGKAAEAVRFAMAQVGKSYVYGASGPSSYDCSGLTMAAWGAAGVSLPHSASAQTGSGQRVSESDLQPGDLVFYYSPVSHVGMYIGNGRIVNAENPSAGVTITSLHAMPYSGAVRPG